MSVLSSGRHAYIPALPLAANANTAKVPSLSIRRREIVAVWILALSLGCGVLK